jgi:hypothetical protein
MPRKPKLPEIPAEPKQPELWEIPVQLHITIGIEKQEDFNDLLLEAARKSVKEWQLRNMCKYGVIGAQSPAGNIGDHARIEVTYAEAVEKLLNIDDNQRNIRRLIVTFELGGCCYGRQQILPLEDRTDKYIDSPEEIGPFGKPKIRVNLPGEVFID